MRTVRRPRPDPRRGRRRGRFGPRGVAHRGGGVALGAAVVAAVAGCASTVTGSAPTEAPATSLGAHTGVSAPASMANFVGQPLSKAEDTLGLGVNVQATDLLKGRHVILPVDWQVCTQSPAPGSPVPHDVQFGVVKRDETCPS